MEKTQITRLQWKPGNYSRDLNDAILNNKVQIFNIFSIQIKATYACNPHNNLQIKLLKKYNAVLGQETISAASDAHGHRCPVSGKFITKFCAHRD